MDDVQKDFEAALTEMQAAFHWQRLRPGARAPIQHHDGDAGFDLTVCMGPPLTLLPGDAADLHCGIAVEPPPGIWFELCGRSSAAQRGLHVGRGIIDGGYRGELFCFVRNISNKNVDIRDGERICQLIPHRVIPYDWAEVEKLTPSKRGDRGFGSTGG